MSKNLEDFLKTREFTQYLNESVEAYEQEHHINRLDYLLMQQSDAALLHTYLGLARMFEQYPSMTSVHPEWTPVIDNDKSIIIRFRLNLTIDGGEVQEYGYDECPSAWGETQAFDYAIEAGEYIGPETWSQSVHSKLVTRELPFTSKDEVLSEMNEELHHFLPGVKAWALTQGLEEAAGAARTTAKRKI